LPVLPVIPEQTELKSSRGRFPVRQPALWKGLMGRDFGSCN
jgi:hypothetical protein